MTQEDKNDDAVSEVVGFILIFGIVVLAIGFIYVAGYPTLQSSMDASIFENAEQSFVVLQSNMKMVSLNQVPVKNLILKLHDTTISTTSESDITIEYDNSTLYYPTGEIEYSKDNKIITYENGGVWKKYPIGQVMVTHPYIYTSTMNNISITTISVVSINGNTSVSGRGIVTLNMQHNASTLTTTSTPVNVTLKINSTYAPLWKSYLENIGFDITASSDSSLTAQQNNTLLMIGRHTVDVEVS
jgi:hypothetical protein